MESRPRLESTRITRLDPQLMDCTIALLPVRKIALTGQRNSSAITSERSELEGNICLC